MVDQREIFSPQTEDKESLVQEPKFLNIQLCKEKTTSLESSQLPLNKVFLLWTAEVPEICRYLYLLCLTYLNFYIGFTFSRSVFLCCHSSACSGQAQKSPFSPRVWDSIFHCTTLKDEPPRAFTESALIHSLSIISMETQTSVNLSVELSLSVV